MDGHTDIELFISGGLDYDIPGRFLVPHRAVGAGVIAIHGHGGRTGRGKSKVVERLSTNPTDGYGLDLVAAGFHVLALDLASFEDRRPLYPLEGPWRTDPERLTASNLLLRGSTLAGLSIFDLRRGVDFLSEWPDLRTRPIFAAGHSLGGALLPYLMMCEDRLAGGVAVSGLSTWRAILDRQAIHSYAVYVPRLLELGDFDTLLPALAPRRLAIISGEHDAGYPVPGVRTLCSRLATAYQQQGAPQNFRSFIHSDGHSMTRAGKAFLVSLLEGWLVETC